jgi:hypothetical protein
MLGEQRNDRRLFVSDRGGLRQSARYRRRPPLSRHQYAYARHCSRSSQFKDRTKDSSRNYPDLGSQGGTS